jgi:hypothetical protein
VIAANFRQGYGFENQLGVRNIAVWNQYVTKMQATVEWVQKGSDIGSVVPPQLRCPRADRELVRMCCHLVGMMNEKLIDKKRPLEV